MKGLKIRRQNEADKLKAEAEALKDKARLEDLHVWEMEKEKRIKKAPRPIPIGWLPGGRSQDLKLMD